MDPGSSVGGSMEVKGGMPECLAMAMAGSYFAWHRRNAAADADRRRKKELRGRWPELRGSPAPTEYRSYSVSLLLGLTMPYSVCCIHAVYTRTVI